MRNLTVLAAVAALALTACGSSGSGGTSSSSAKGLKLGGPPECTSRPFCEPGLKSTYNIKISSFKALDAGGPLTVKAIKDGTVDFGLVFTSDPTVVAQGLTVLTDDKHLQASDSVVPVINTKFNKAPATTALKAVNLRLTQDALIAMNTAVQLQHVPAATVANGFLSTLHLDTKQTLCANASGSGTVTVGAFNFSESSLLANLYAAALKVCGYSTKVKSLGSREVVYPALAKGDLDLVPEYAATLTDFINTKKNGPSAASKASTDIDKTMTALRAELPSSLVALDPATATDQNAFAVTKTLADAHSLKTMSDLATYSQT
jgi:osmoprotectant transport system substrate-binding protein